MTKKRLLIVAHAPSPNTVALRDAMVRGAAQLELDEIEIVGRRAFETGPADVTPAQAIILGTTENLGYMSAALKDFFDLLSSPFLAHTQGLPSALLIRAGHDCTGPPRHAAALATAPPE